MTLNVPTGSRLRASAVFSALHVEGRLAACRFRTSMGNVWLEEAGTIDVRTGAGAVTAGASRASPPRKVYSLNAQGREYLEEFWRTWSFLAERLEQLHKGGR